MTDHWAEANGGLRGSNFLMLGAAAYLLAAALNLAGRLLTSEPPGPGNTLFMVAMLVWVMTLFLVGTGLVWTGIQPVLSRLGLAVGFFFYAQGLYLLLALFSRAELPFPPSVLTVGRTMLLVVFAVAERAHLGRRTALFLGLISGLHFGRVILRHFEIWPPMAQPWEPALTAFFMAATAAAVFAVGRVVREKEDAWALEHAPRRGSPLAEFNNPRTM